MTGWFVVVFLGGMLIDLVVGIGQTTNSIKNHPEKWEPLGIVLEKKTGSYMNGWVQGWKEGSTTTAKGLGMLKKEDIE